MKKNFETPKLTIVLFVNEDVILTSSNGPEGIGPGGEEGSDDEPGD